MIIRITRNPLPEKKSSYFLFLISSDSGLWSSALSLKRKKAPSFPSSSRLWEWSLSRGISTHCPILDTPLWNGGIAGPTGRQRSSCPDAIRESGQMV
ncbi:hypothetical protein, partial [Cupriavidus metallidurans]|uniref:hypothetical protein n=1 Tax=Cupriavidus metallidurans TaxID=119219 RepID=UPI001F3DF437